MRKVALAAILLLAIAAHYFLKSSVGLNGTAAEAEARLPPNAGLAPLESSPPSSTDGKEGYKIASHDKLVTTKDRGATIASQARSIIRMDLCGDPAVERSVSIDKLIQYEKLHGRKAAAELTERQLAELCATKSSELPVHIDARLNLSDFVREQSTLFQETEAFLSLAAEDAINGKEPGSPSERNAFVLEKLRMSNNLFEFNEISEELARSKLLGDALQSFGYPQSVQEEISVPATVIAGCRIFGGCGAASEFAIQICFLTCDRPMTVEEYIVNSIPPRDHEMLWKAVNAIVRARNTGG